MAPAVRQAVFGSVLGGLKAECPRGFLMKVKTVSASLGVLAFVTSLST